MEFRRSQDLQGLSWLTWVHSEESRYPDFHFLHSLPSLLCLKGTFNQPSDIIIAHNLYPEAGKFSLENSAHILPRGHTWHLTHTQSSVPCNCKGSLKRTHRVAVDMARHSAWRHLCVCTCSLASVVRVRLFYGLLKLSKCFAYNHLAGRWKRIHAHALDLVCMCAQWTHVCKHMAIPRLQNLCRL